jgi:hypothetical protein
VRPVAPLLLAACALALAPRPLSARGASARLTFDAADLKLNGGNGYKTANNASGTLAWGESYVMIGYAAMFRATGEAAYLVALADHALAVLASRDSVRGLKDYAGKSRPCWQSTKYSSGGEPFCWVVHSGMITYAMADLALLVKQHPSLGAVAAPGGTLGSVAQALVAELEKTVQTHEAEWKSGPGAGEGHYVGDAKASFTTVAGKALPLNQMTALGQTLVVLAQATGNASHRAKAQALATYLRNRMAKNGAALAWTYWGEPWSAGKGEDISHAAINVEFAARCHAAGLVFSAADMRALARTLVDRVHVDSDTAADLVDGGGGTNQYKPALGRWLALAPFDARAWAIAASAYRTLSGTSGSELAGLAALAEHAPSLRTHGFYHVDWQDLGAHRKATAYGANLLLDPPQPKQPCAFRVAYRATKRTTLAQWDGKAYHAGITLAPTTGSAFVAAYAPYDPLIYFAYSGSKALFELEDTFVAGQGIEVQEPTPPVDPSILTAQLPAATAGVAYAATLAGAGDPPLLWRVVQGPAGLAIDAKTGALSWTPSAATLPASLTVRLDNDAGEAVRDYTVAAAGPVAVDARAVDDGGAARDRATVVGDGGIVDRGGAAPASDGDGGGCGCRVAHADLGDAIGLFALLVLFVAPRRALRAIVPLLVAGALAGCAGTRRTNPADAGPRPEQGLSWGDGSSWLADWRPESGPPPPPADGPRAERPRDTRPSLQPDRAPPPDQPPPPPCPGGCDDGNPCTADACVADSCVHTPAGQVVQRYYSAATGAHAYSPAGVPAAGFKLEGPAFRTLGGPVAGSAQVHQQTNGKDYMLSLDASEGIACCGYWNAGGIGHGLGAAAPGAIALYRLYHSKAGLHLSSTSASEGTQVGYALEGITVWVCPL